MNRRRRIEQSGKQNYKQILNTQFIMGNVLCCYATRIVYLMSYTHNSSAQYKPQSSGFFAKSSGVQCAESKRLCSATACQGLSYRGVSTITAYWEQWEGNALAHFSREWSRSSTLSGVRDCVCVCVSTSLI